PSRAVRRFAFCCTFRRLAPPRRYLAPCPVEPGLSSASFRMTRLPGRLRQGHCLTSLAPKRQHLTAQDPRRPREAAAAAAAAAAACRCRAVAVAVAVDFWLSTFG